MRVLISGGTGAVSARVTRETLERGHEALVAVTRTLTSVHAARLFCADRPARREPACELRRFAPDVGVLICFEPARVEGWVALFGAAPGVRINGVTAG